jgi:hypothetical protein
MLSFSISYWDLIKFPYFVDTTEIGDRGESRPQREGDFMDNFNISFSSLDPIFSTYVANQTILGLLGNSVI